MVLKTRDDAGKHELAALKKLDAGLLAYGDKTAARIIAPGVPTDATPLVSPSSL